MSVSGTVTGPDGAGLGGVTITVEQVGGELPNLTTTTAPNGTFSISDPLLFGNLKVTPSLAAFGFSPATRETFTSGAANLTGQNFSAFSLAEIDVLLDNESLTTPATLTRTVPDSEGTVFNLTVLNSGTAPLTGIGISAAGPQAASFILPPVPATLAARATAAVPVRLPVSTAGSYEVTLSIASNDSSENPFIIKLKVSVVHVMVDNTNDSGPGSLRSAAEAATLMSIPPVITFAPALSGQTITLASEIALGPLLPLTIDGRGLALRPVIRASQNAGGHRIFNIVRGASVTLSGLIVSEGSANGNRGGNIRNEGALLMTDCIVRNGSALSSDGNAGGAGVSNGGQLSVERCLFLENAASQGSAVYNEGSAGFTDCTFRRNGIPPLSGVLNGGAITSNSSLSLTGCSFIDNMCFGRGGALYAIGEVHLERCTLAGNFSNFMAGAIYAIRAGLIIDHCTITGNFAGSVGGVFLDNEASAHVNRSIIAGNSQVETSSHSADIEGAVFTNFVNIIQQFDPFQIGGIPPLNQNPLLSAPGDFGGPAFTCALLPGSPARDAAGGSFSQVDQRGFPMVGTPDIGAYEAGNAANNLNAFLWEMLPVEATVEQHEGAFDFDGDGQSNEAEWLSLTNPSNPASVFSPQVTLTGGSMEIRFPSMPGRNYSLLQSDTLAAGSWAPASGLNPLPGNGALHAFFVPLSQSRRFFQVMPSVP